MSFDDEFRDAIAQALGSRSPITVAREAGLPRMAITTVLEGKPPSLGRAAEIADAFGLRLRLHRKDLLDLLQPMRLAVEHLLERPRDNQGEKELPPLPQGTAVEHREAHSLRIAMQAVELLTLFRQAFAAWDCPDPERRMEEIRDIRRILGESGVGYEELPEATMRAFIVARTSFLHDRYHEAGHSAWPDTDEESPGGRDAEDPENEE